MGPKPKKDTGQKLAESEQMYRRLFEVSEDPMWLIIDHKFEICNEAAVKVLGYDSEDDLKSTHPSFLSPEHQPDGQPSFDKAEQMMAMALDRGYHRFEWMHKRKNGEDFPVEVTLTKIPMDDDIAIYCVWRDISKRKAIEAALELAKEEAETANQHKSSFLTMMSHELRTPLNAILGFSEYLERGLGGELNPKQKDAAHNIHRGGRLLLGLVEDLLNMAHIEQGELNLKLEKINAVEALEQAAKIVGALAHQQGIEVICEVDQVASCTMIADRIRLEQVIVNLMSNAVKYNAPGGHVWLRAQCEPNNTIQISVIDDGLGIPAEKLEEVFQPFNRGGKESSGIEGTGLGLTICKYLVEAMSGDCKIESTEGKGTTFTLIMGCDPI